MTSSHGEGILKLRLYSKMVVRSMTEALLEQMAAVLRALGHPTRLRIVEFLVEEDLCSGRDCSGEKCVCEIIPALGMEQSSVSKHLAILRDRGIVNFRREGTRTLYSLADARVLDILGLARQVCMGHLVRAEKVLAEARQHLGLAEATTTC